MRCVCLLKSTHRGFRGPNNFLRFCVAFTTQSKPIFRRRFDRCGRLDRSRCSKTVANSVAFALYLPTKIDASRYSGTEPLASISLIHPTARAHSRGDFAIRITTSSLFIGLMFSFSHFFFLSSSFSFLLLSSLPPPSSSLIDLRTSIKARWPRAKNLYQLSIPQRRRSFDGAALHM